MTWTDWWGLYQNVVSQAARWWASMGDVAPPLVRRWAASRTKRTPIRLLILHPKFMDHKIWPLLTATVWWPRMDVWVDDVPTSAQRRLNDGPAFQTSARSCQPPHHLIATTQCDSIKIVHSQGVARTTSPWKIGGIAPALAQCWINVADAGPTLGQCWPLVWTLKRHLVHHALVIGRNPPFIAQPILSCQKAVTASLLGKLFLHFVFSPQNRQQWSEDYLDQQIWRVVCSRIQILNKYCAKYPEISRWS